MTDDPLKGFSPCDIVVGPAGQTLADAVAAEHEKAVRQRARDDADSLDNERPLFESALEVAAVAAADLAADGGGPDAFLDAVEALGEERAAEIYGDEWDAILREAEGRGSDGEGAP